MALILSDKDSILIELIKLVAVWRWGLWNWLSTGTFY